MVPYVIRPMREADLPGRAAVHCRDWEETYRGQIPDVVLDGMTPEAIEAAVRALPMETLVVEGAEGIVGFACFCPEARAFTGRRNTSEIAALYLLRSVQGPGLGPPLMEAVLAVLPHPEELPGGPPGRGKVVLAPLRNAVAGEAHRHRPGLTEEHRQHTPLLGGEVGEAVQIEVHTLRPSVLS